MTSRNRDRTHAWLDVNGPLTMGTHRSLSVHDCARRNLHVDIAGTDCKTGLQSAFAGSLVLVAVGEGEPEAACPRRNYDKLQRCRSLRAACGFEATGQKLKVASANENTVSPVRSAASSNSVVRLLSF